MCRHVTYVTPATHHIRQGLNPPARSCHSFETFQEVCEIVPNGPQCMFSDSIPVVHILYFSSLYLLVICVPTTLIWDVVHCCCILVRQRVERRPNVAIQVDRDTWITGGIAKRRSFNRRVRSSEASRACLGHPATFLEPWDGVVGTWFDVGHKSWYWDTIAMQYPTSIQLNTIVFCTVYIWD